MSDRGPSPTSSVAIDRYVDGAWERREDCVSTEEPMEIRVVFGPLDRRAMRSISITMRTPGEDEALALGFLFTEGVIASANDVEQIRCSGTLPTGVTTGNILRVDLRPDAAFDPSRLQRHFFTTSSCGVCGKASLEALEARGVAALPPADEPVVAPPVLATLPAILRAGQSQFDATGGIHAAGLFHPSGALLRCCEDVGRHNAVDKLIGFELREASCPLDTQRVLAVSGRTSFEILQKALVARIPIVVAVGAPSSLAIQLAEANQMTLVGFTSERRFNVYAGRERIG